jgi:exopolysaccharide production protein ExoZ
MSVSEKKQGKLLSVQAARGVAALLVVLYHSGRMVALPQYVGFIPLSGFFNFGHAGVDFFFVLSGFIIYFVHNGDIGRSEAIPRYLWRRLTRIYPIYWIVTAFILVLASLRPERLELGHVVKSILLMPHNMEPLLGVAWTLQHEILFYLMFLTLIIRRHVGIISLVLWVTVIIAGISRMLPHSYGLLFIASPFHLQFFMGMAVAHIIINHKVPAPHLWALSGACAFFVVCMSENARLVSATAALSQTLYGLSAAITLLGFAAVELKGDLIIAKSASFLGEASYSIYLLHTIVIGLSARVLMNLGIVKTMPGWSVMVCAAVAAVVSASMLYQFVERPLLVRLYRFGQLYIYASPARVPAAGQSSSGSAEAPAA